MRHWPNSGYQTLVRSLRAISLLLLLSATPALAQAQQADEAAQPSVARMWNEAVLEAIRNDFARPTVHARNLYHLSVAMWDAWATFDRRATGVLNRERLTVRDPQTAREEAISYAAYRLLSWRFANSPGAEQTLLSFDELMLALGYDTTMTSTAGDSPAALGNRIGQAYIKFGLQDGANELENYGNRFYHPVNSPLAPTLPGNPDLSDPNRWQPLALGVFIDQAGQPVPSGAPQFLSPEWGYVTPFALAEADLTVYRRDGFDYRVYHDPGPPPYLGGEGDPKYKDGFAQVAVWSGLLDPSNGAMIDISPGARGNNTLGTNDGHGRPINPATGHVYSPQVVPAGDYYRVLAEFWADGPASETPPGHWFTIANGVTDHPAFKRRLGGRGRKLNALEWDVKMYLALGGAMHDVAIAVWGAKGWYDYIRPISAIRFMCDMGQSSDPQQPSYHPDGIRLVPGHIEPITAQSAMEHERHAHIAGESGEHIGKIALYAWRGPDYIDDPAADQGGTGWIRCENWWPYQRPTFVTPPFAGYVSGHSTYSRAAAEVLTLLTGDPYFPGGMGVFAAPRNEFLVFEEGPSVDIELQWATYRDAADECSLSRIYGGIHPPQDDIPGRLMGAKIGPQAFHKALQHFRGKFAPRPDFAGNRGKLRH